MHVIIIIQYPIHDLLPLSCSLSLPSQLVSVLIPHPMAPHCYARRRLGSGCYTDALLFTITMIMHVRCKQRAEELEEGNYRSS